MEPVTNHAPLLRNRRGLTLTELIVSTMLIGIVMVGVASFTFAIKSIQESTNKSTVLAAQAAAMMGRMTKIAERAIGWQDDPGIVVDAATISGTAYSWLSLRIDANPPTPGTYTDDTWYIFCLDTSNNLYEVIQAATSLPASRSSSTPDEAATPADNCEDIGKRLANNVTSLTWDFQHDSNVLDPKFYIDIDLTLRFTPADTAHPIDNPQYNLATRVSPVAHSW